MKLFLAIMFITGSYLVFLLGTTNIVLGQVNNLNKTYQYVANNADEIATGQKSVTDTNHRLNQEQQAALEGY